MPLSTIIVITAIKDLYEDIKRKKSDKEENSKKILTGNNDNFYEKKMGKFKSWKYY